MIEGRGLLGTTVTMCTAFERAAVWLTAVVFVAGVAPSASVPRARHDQRGGGRAVCSPREPFKPPVLATLPAGVLALDGRRGLAVVVSGQTTPHAASLSVATYSIATGRVVRSRRISTAPASSGAPSAVVNDALSVVVDGTTERIFVLHEPYAAGLYPVGRVDVLDERTLVLLRGVRVGRVALFPALDERTGRVFVANQQSGTVSVLDAGTGQLLRTVAVSRGPLGPSAPPVADERSDRVFFAADTAQGNVVVLDARSGAIVRRVTVSAYPQVLALDRSAGHVLVAGSGIARLLDARTGSLLRAAMIPGSPRAALVDEAGHSAFIGYGDNANVSMLDMRTGVVLRTIPVRLENTHPAHPRRPRGTDQAENETYSIVDRVDERRHWVVVRVPAVMADDGPEQGPSQITVLDSRTGLRIHTVFSEPAWPDALAVDDRRGRAFSNVGGAIDMYDISCLNSYYIFGDLG